jgi:hypothetical protein
VKFLRNPWVSGALAVAAVAVVIFQVLGPQSRSRRPAPSNPQPPATAAPPPVAAKSAPIASQPAPPPAPVPSRPALEDTNKTPEPLLDRAYLDRHFAGWVNAPRRDPFLLVTPVVQKSVAPTNSPVRLWKVRALWNQTGGLLAVINNKVYSVGDEIHGYRIERIEGDEVWFAGTNGIERLEILGHRSAVPATLTNGMAPPDPKPGQP